MATTGRRSKQTEDMVALIERSLLNHNSIKHTCGMVGISQDTFFRWMRESEAAGPNSKKRKFSERIKRAQASSVTILVNSIAKDPNWQSKAWLLERLHPQEFGKKQTLNHAGAPEGEPDMPAAQVSPVAVIIADSDGIWNHEQSPVEEATEDDLPEEV